LEKTNLSVFTPKWEGAIEGMIVNTIKKNMFRAPHWMEFADCYQDLYLLYANITQRYRINSSQHCMVLVQRCAVNYFHKLAAKRTRHSEIPVSSTAYVDNEVNLLDNATNMYNTVSNFGLNEAELEDCPELIKNILLKLDKDDLPDYEKLDNGQRESTNEYLCHLAEAPNVKLPIIAMILAWIEGRKQVA
jgi:hypothetical protein